MEASDAAGLMRFSHLVEGSIGWTVFFHCCYWVCRVGAAKVFDTYAGLERDKRGYWCASMVSSFHAALITVLSVKALVEDPSLAAGNDFFYATPSSLQATRIFLGYIFSDLMLSIYYRARWPGWVENLVHHVCIIMTWAIFLHTRSGQFFACIAHICELTTPFVNQRWFLYEAGLKSTTVYFYNGLAMVFLWFVTRILLYTYCGYKLIVCREDLERIGFFPTIVVVFCYTSGLALQFFWFYKIMRGAVKSLRSRATEHKKAL